LGGICDVCAEADDRIVGTTELVVDHGQSFRVTREDGNARVCVTQPPPNRQADTPCAAGDEGNPS
jgi:hypothetical protein